MDRRLRIRVRRHDSGVQPRAVHAQPDRPALGGEAHRLRQRPPTAVAVQIIHEMGHVFALRVPPEDSDEDRFFGWGYIIARKLHCARRWLGLYRAEGRPSVREEIEYAAAYGLLIRGQPVAIR